MREEIRAQLRWLVRLRWFMGIATTLLVIVVHVAVTELPILPLLAIVAASLGSNVVISAWRARASRAWIGAILGFDVAVTTALLALTGGPLNPFTTLYLVYIALAAVVLGARGIWLLTGLSALGYAILFFGTDARSLGGPDHAKHMRIHLEGMWLAFAVASGFIGYFVSRIQRSLAEQRHAIAELRARAARSEKLTALATMAAGAAHELGTPLSTIAVAAKELERRLEGLEREDAALIRTEVARCRAILDGMSIEAGGTVGEEPTAIAIGALIREIDARIAIEGEATVRAPRRALTLALRNVVRNALDASSEVRATIAVGAEGARVEIVDRGEGIDEADLARLGEPFFTTKAPGHGMGLGIFLTRAIVEQLGGTIVIRSEKGRGTTVAIELPA
jgi:two-component system sensor histidine kinase RegB